MGNTELLSRTRHLVTLPFLGTLAAMASETFHMLGEAGIAAKAGEDALAVFSPGLANMEPMFAALFTITALPIIVLALRPSRMIWIVALLLVIILLIANAAHSLIHIAKGNYGAILIVAVTVLIPYALATSNLWKGARQCSSMTGTSPQVQY